MTRRRRAVLLGLLVGALALLVAAPALADRAFKARFSANANGDIAAIGNTLETCQASAADCGRGRDGEGPLVNNNNFVMERVDIDKDPNTFDSSSAHLNLPSGGRVLFAGLYYGARTNAGTRGKAAPDSSRSALGTVDVRAPGQSSYERLGGSAAVLDESTDVSGAYQAFHDVTGLVRRAGSGVYTIANVQSATGEDRYAGWSLVVADEAPADPPRNLTVFDGLHSVTLGKPGVTIPISGFQTPLSGPVRTRLGFVAYEGDLGYTGDSAALNGQLLTDPVNPAKNFFNSGISIDGRPFTAKTPDYLDQLGFDAKLTRIDGILANGATSADISLRTASEQYLPGAITFATDLYAPVIRGEKAVSDLTHPGGPAKPGDVLRYTVKYTNDGQEAATNFVANDPVPPGTTYLPGTLKIAGAGTAPTDVVGDDLGDYEPGRHAVRFYLGQGASVGHGGALAAHGVAGNEASFSFEVRVDPSPGGLTEIANSAQATFVAPTLGKELSALSPTARIPLAHAATELKEADLAVAESETLAPTADGGGDVEDVITAENHGPSDATDVKVLDDLPLGAVVESASTDVGSCAVNATEVTCTVSRLDNHGSAEIEIVEHVPALDAHTGALNEAVATSPQFDPRPANNSRDAAATPPPGPQSTSAESADLSVQGQFDKSRVPFGGTVEGTVTLHNLGPNDAVGVKLEDALSADAQLLSLRSGKASCSRGLPLRCKLADLPSGATDTLKLSLRPLRPGELLDTVVTGADTRDPKYANNMTKARTTVNAARAAVRISQSATPPVVSRGQLVRIRIRIAARGVIPAVGSVLCVRLPAALRVRSAPGAQIAGSRVCWAVGELVPGEPQSFQISARVASASRGARLVSIARLSGSNFATRSAGAAVQVPPPLVACSAGVIRARPRARIAC